MEQWLEIRQRVLREGVSKRQIMRETGMHWETLKNILEHPSPPGYQRSKFPKKPKIDPYLSRVQEILEQDKCVHKKQRHTAKRIWEVLQEEGFTGGYTIVKDAVRELRRTMKEVYMPLSHRPGEAQVDFGHAVVKTKAKLLLEEQMSFLGLPFTPFEACRTQNGRVNSELLVRFDDNDYSVPMEYAYQDVVVKGYTDRVRVCRLHEVIAEHPRCWGREQQIFDPLHYLPLLERKPYCLAFGRPFEALDLPGCFEVLQRRMEWELDHGRREYVQVLRLLERYSLHQLTSAVQKALKRRVHTKDGIEQFLAGCRPWRQTSFKLGHSEHLRLVQVSQSDVGAYGGLLGQGGAA